MFKVKVLNQEVLKEVLEMSAVIQGVESAYVQKAEKKTELFPMVFHEFDPGVADMDIKSGHLMGAEIFGLKLVSWYGENASKGLPLLIGTTMIFDNKTGAPLAILNADHVTGMRTGAAGAIGAKYLAKKNSKSLLMVGTGHISKFEIAACLLAVPSLEKVVIHDPRNHEMALKLKDSLKQTLKDEFNIEKNIEVTANDHLENAVKSADIIITATPSKSPMIKKEWVQAGTHFSCIGADMSGKQEIDETLFKDALVVIDDVEQAIHVGETEKAYQEKIIGKTDLHEIGQIINGSHPGRVNDDEITIFDSTGIAIQDLITSKIALDLANKQNLGITIDL